MDLFGSSFYLVHCLSGSGFFSTVFLVLFDSWVLSLSDSVAHQILGFNWFCANLVCVLSVRGF